MVWIDATSKISKDHNHSYHIQFSQIWSFDKSSGAHISISSGIERFVYSYKHFKSSDSTSQTEYYYMHINILLTPNFLFQLLKSLSKCLPQPENFTSSFTTLIQRLTKPHRFKFRVMNC